jgi:hypothetical protein
MSAPRARVLKSTRSKTKLPSKAPRARSFKRLTFGVEFELNLAALHNDDPDPEPHNKTPVLRIDPDAVESEYTIVNRAITKSLAAVGIPIELEQPLYNGPVKDCWLIDIDESIDPPEGETFLSHRAGRDLSLLLRPRHQWEPRELKTPPYIYSEGSLEAVKLACSRLTNDFRCNMNDSCGLHVHVGNGFEGFEFELVRKLMVFFWTFEGQVDQIHKEPRAHGDYFPSLRVGSNMAQRYRNCVEEVCALDRFHLHCKCRQRLMPVTDGIKQILATTSINELDKLLRCEDDSNLERTHKHKYNLHFLTSPAPLPAPASSKLSSESRPATTKDKKPTVAPSWPPNGKRTIEFRQAAGTLDGDFVTAWISTLVGIIEMCRRSDEANLLQFCREYAKKEDEEGPDSMVDIVDLLRLCGLDEVSAFWETWLARQGEERREPTDYGQVLTWLRGKEDEAMNGVVRACDPDQGGGVDSSDEGEEEDDHGAAVDMTPTTCMRQVLEAVADGLK